MSARRSAIVSNSLAERASSSSSSGSTFALISLTVISTVAEDSSASSYGTRLRLAGRGADERGLDLLHEPAGAELDDGVALGLAVGRDDVDDERVALLRGPVLGRHELGDRFAQRLELLCDQLLGHLGVRLADLELRPVDDLDLGLHGHGRLELPAGVVLGRQLVVELRLRDRPDARAGGRVPEPAGDVAVHRLGEDPLVAEPLLQDRDRDLAWPEAGDLHRRGEIGGGVLDRVVDVVRRHVHRQADGVAVELLDLRLHQAIQAERRARGVELSGERGHPLLDLVAQLADARERLAGRILEPPVDVRLAREAPGRRRRSPSSRPRPPRPRPLPAAAGAASGRRGRSRSRPSPRPPRDGGAARRGCRPSAPRARRSARGRRAPSASARRSRCRGRARWPRT